jgi:hypothetical protein
VIYEHLSFTRSRVWKFPRSAAASPTHAAPQHASISSRQYRFAMGLMKLMMVTKAPSQRQGHRLRIDQPRPDFRNRLAGDVLRFVTSAIVSGSRANGSNAGTVVGSLRFLGFAANRSTITSLRLLVSRKLDSQSFAQWTKAARLEIVCRNHSVVGRMLCRFPTH